MGGPGRPGIVHRLDLDTTGVMVVARSPAAYVELSEAFAERRIGKRYLAIAYGVARPESGRIDRPLGRHPRDRKKMTVRADGREAITDYRTLDVAHDLSVLELTLHTGRTHQIRVHLKAERLPLVGDPVYGEARLSTAGAPGGAQAVPEAGAARLAAGAGSSELRGANVLYRPGAGGPTGAVVGAGGEGIEN